MVNTTSAPATAAATSSAQWAPLSTRPSAFDYVLL